MSQGFAVAPLVCCCASDKPASIPFAAGVAEAVVRQQFDPVDIVTEVINRVETALEMARTEGGNKAHSLAPMLQPNAVA